ncbi:hypothetical protein J3Q64DRAFT_1864941 [Phycomyces blakesleeanus]|uniref:G-protein coupled receptors family 1 profile domain-containing protein n=1 Tax=Phycomyces blakesleeanus TaxID=4837 RepID=A0ABR3AV70_PHYBL
MDAVEAKRDLPYYFVGHQRTGLLVAGLVPAGITIIVCTLVIISHFSMRFYRPEVANRVSLHLIVTASTDTMSCTCLAMVGVNLVLIFIVNVNRPWRFEKYYYILIGIVGVIVIVMPLAISSSPENVVETCWYHYYFIGRFTRYFNWMWYYGWLLLSSAVAAICAFLALRKFSREQHNFASIINMRQSNETQAPRRPVNPRQKIIQKNTALFRKVASRCICYPLVPIISKAAGIAVEISLMRKVHIPYSVFVLERITSTVREAISDLFKLAVRYYVEDYYCMYFIPEQDENGKMLNFWVKNPYSVTLHCIPEPIEDMRASASMGYTTLKKDTEKNKKYSLIGLEGLRRSITADQTHKSRKKNSSTLEFNHHNSFRKRYSYVHPLVRLVIVDGKYVCSQHSYKETKYIANISTDPMALGDEINHVQSRLTFMSRLQMVFTWCTSARKKYAYRKVPMYRVRPAQYLKDGNESNESSLLYEKERWRSGSDYIGRASFQFFRYPFLARVLHWILIHIFRTESPGNINPAFDRDVGNTPGTHLPSIHSSEEVDGNPNIGLFENANSFAESRNDSNLDNIATDSIHPLDSVIISDPAEVLNNDQSYFPSTSLTGELMGTAKEFSKNSPAIDNNPKHEPKSYFDFQPARNSLNCVGNPNPPKNRLKPLVIDTPRLYPNTEYIQSPTNERPQTTEYTKSPRISKYARNLSFGDVSPILRDRSISSQNMRLNSTKSKGSSWSIMDALNLSRNKPDSKHSSIDDTVSGRESNRSQSGDTAKSKDNQIPEKHPFSKRLRASFKISESRQAQSIDDYPPARSSSSTESLRLYSPLPEVADSQKLGERKEWSSALSPPPRSHFIRNQTCSKQMKDNVTAEVSNKSLFFPFGNNTSQGSTVRIYSPIGSPGHTGESRPEKTMSFNDMVGGLEECHSRVVHVSNWQHDDDSGRLTVGYETWDADNALEEYANNLASLIHRA